MKITATKGRLLIFSLAAAGICALIGGSLLMVFYDKIVRYFMQKQMLLKPGNEFFEMVWKELPIRVMQKVFIFNITNPKEFSNGSKPVLQELGPYVYSGRWAKEPLDWDDQNGTVSYKDIKEYTFVPELSNGDLEEMIYTLNIPLLTVVNYVEEFTPVFFRGFIADLMNGVFETYSESLLVHRTVREMIYEGYHEPMVSDLVKVVEPFMDLPVQLVNDTFGFLHEKKHIGDGIFTVKSGVNGLDDYTSITMWNNQSSVDWWQGSCNEISGTDAGQFAPGVTNNKTLMFFNPNLCRSVPLNFEKDVTVHGIKALRFGMPKNTFGSVQENDANECFCSDFKCEYGLIPLSCKKGAPLMISLPHFLEGGEDLLESVSGINASVQKHQSYLDIEPNTGFVLNAAFRIEINGITRQYPEYSVLADVSDHVVPVMWVSEEAQLDANLANYFKTKVQIPLIVFRVVCIASIAIGAFWTISSVVFLFCMETRVKPDDLKHSVVLKTLNSVYTSVALWPPEEDAKEGTTSEKTHL